MGTEPKGVQEPNQVTDGPPQWRDWAKAEERRMGRERRSQQGRYVRAYAQLFVQ